MIKIYDRALRMVNPKLYYSKYKVNTMQVFEVLKNFKLGCRLNYLRNLLTLKIDNISKERLEKCDVLATAVYNTLSNEIKLEENSNKSDFMILNHELFHVSSNRKKKTSGIVYLDGNNMFGNSLNEGITEYLNFKINSNNSYTGYQMELFVIEMLVFIFGESILEPYFKNDGQKFFKQFKDHSRDVILLDRYLSIMNINLMAQYSRLKYLYFSSLVPHLLRSDSLYLEKLELDSETCALVNFLLARNKDKIINVVPSGGLETMYDYENVEYSDQEKRYFKKLYILNYNMEQRLVFRKIFDLLLKLAYSKGISSEVIESFIIENIKNKDDSFKAIYGELIDKKMRSMIRKR